jgi:hypothetical protein
MKEKILQSILIFGTAFVVWGCGSGNTNDMAAPSPETPGDGSVTLPADIVDAINAPYSTLSQNLKDAITYMYSEEGLAHDVYLNIYKIQEVEQLQNIATKSEVKHIEAVRQLAKKYDLNMTQYPDTDIPYSIAGIGDGNYPVDTVQYLYDLLYNKGIASEENALEVGCIVEVVDIDDLDKYIEYAQTSNASDALTVFEFLRNGSYSHYWAFDKGLKNRGVEEGCCSLEDMLGYHFCHPEYPQNDNGGREK